MTKREKLECSSPGCHEKRTINIQLFALDIVSEKYYCGTHWLQFIGYMATFLSQNKEYKKDIFEGIDLFKDGEINKKAS